MEGKTTKLLDSNSVPFKSNPSSDDSQQPYKQKACIMIKISTHLFLIKTEEFDFMGGVPLSPASTLTSRRSSPFLSAFNKILDVKNHKMNEQD